MEWSNEKVLEFIQLYETESVIWNPSHPDHKKKHLVHDAWIRIKSQLSWNSTIEEMKKKKDSLMAYYRAHRNKIKKSIKSGASADDVYQTNWFAFSAMNSFLQPIYDCRSTVETQNESVDDDHAEWDEESNTVTRSNEDSTPTLPSNSKVTNKRVKIDLSSETLHAKSPTQDASDHVETNDEYEIFGKLIASKLRKIKNLNTRDILMNDMHNMVSRACIVDRVCPQNVQLPQSYDQTLQNLLYSMPSSSPQN